MEAQALDAAVGAARGDHPLGRERWRRLASRQEVAELAVLDHARGELIATGRVVEKLERARAAGHAAEQAEVLRTPHVAQVRREPQIDPTGVGRDLRVGLDGTVTLERVAHHLLSELIEPGARHRGDDGTTRRDRQRNRTNAVAWQPCTISNTDASRPARRPQARRACALGIFPASPIVPSGRRMLAARRVLALRCGVATLPRSARRRPRRPWVPITMRSAWVALAVRRIASAGIAVGDGECAERGGAPWFDPLLSLNNNPTRRRS